VAGNIKAFASERGGLAARNNDFCNKICQQQTFNDETRGAILAKVTVMAPRQLLGEAPQHAAHNPPVAAKAPSVKNVDLRSAHECPLEARVLRRYARDEPETRR